MSTPHSLIVHGAAGRMGRRVVAMTLADPSLRLIAAVDHADHPSIGSDAGILAGEPTCGIALLPRWPSGHQASKPVVIDFSLPSAISACVDACVAGGYPLVVATTGLDETQRQCLHAAARSIPIVWAPSMSLAVNLSMRMCQQMAAALRDVTGGVDVEIIERHHRFKADAPSGTALRFGELIAEQLAGETSSGEQANAPKPATAIAHVHGRHGHTGERTRAEIGYHAVRVGDNPGEHTIVFGMMGEKIELNVAASNRDCYAIGAIAAAKWLITRGDAGPGMHDMFDVLGMTPPNSAKDST